MAGRADQPGRPAKVERNQAMLAMRKAGASYRQIGAVFGVCGATAQKVCRRLMGNTHANRRQHHE